MDLTQVSSARPNPAPRSRGRVRSARRASVPEAAQHLRLAVRARDGRRRGLRAVALPLVHELLDGDEYARRSMSGPQPPGNSPRLPSWLWASTASSKPCTAWKRRGLRNESLTHTGDFRYHNLPWRVLGRPGLQRVRGKFRPAPGTLLPLKFRASPLNRWRIRP